MLFALAKETKNKKRRFYLRASKVDLHFALKIDHVPKVWPSKKYDFMNKHGQFIRFP